MQQKIANRLGWLSAPALMADALASASERLPTAVQQRQVTDVVLLGMGGSSLAPEVLRAILGVAPGSPRFRMIDSTDPAAVRSVTSPPERTLYVLASKSGTTIEPNSLAAHFRKMLERAGVGRWADHFVAITDEGTALAARARTDGFRELFINPGDIGGRYSALSYFGLVPAALMGHDVEAILGWGIAMLEEAAAIDAAGGESRGRPRHRDGRRRAERQRQGDAGDAPALRTVRPLGRAARRRKHRQTGRGHRADRGRTGRIARRVWERPALHPPPQREQRRDACARDRRPACRRRADRDRRRRRACRTRGRVRPLGDCDGRRGRDSRREPVRRAERPAGERRDPHSAGGIQGERTTAADVRPILRSSAPRPR